jgi:hypothetical protein
MAATREAHKYPIKYAKIEASTVGDNTLVSAVTGKKIRVLSYSFIVSAATTVRFESGAGGTALTGVMSFPDDAGTTCGFNEGGWFETDASALLNMELSADGADGHLSYIEVPA